MNRQSKIQLNAPAGNPASLVAAVDAQADSVYIGFQSATNLRNLPGLNFSVQEAADGIQYAHRHGVKVHVTVNTYPTDSQVEDCFRAIDDAADIGADAVIVTDLAVLEHARSRHSSLEIHLSCAAGATDPEAIRFYRDEFEVDCVVLPRVLSLVEIAALRQETDVLLETMVFGVLCGNYDGRCSLSSFITGISAYNIGACAPAEFVEFDETEDGRTVFRLNGIAIDDFLATEGKTYPTPCKGKYFNTISRRSLRAFQDPCCMNALSLLPRLVDAGIDIAKIEGRQRSPAYVGSVTSAWRSAIDALEVKGSDFLADKKPALESVLEGMNSSLGPLVGG